MKKKKKKKKVISKSILGYLASLAFRLYTEYIIDQEIGMSELKIGSKLGCAAVA